MHGITFTPAALIGFEVMLAKKSKPVVDDIRKKLSSSSDGAVHVDETYWITDGERSHFWVHCSHNFVHFQYDTSRAGEVSRDVLGDDFLGTLVTDCYGGYAASAAGAKRKCLANLARTARDWQKLAKADSIDFAFFEDVRQIACCEGCTPTHRGTATSALMLLVLIRAQLRFSSTPATNLRTDLQSRRLLSPRQSPSSITAAFNDTSESKNQISALPKSIEQISTGELNCYLFAPLNKRDLPLVPSLVLGWTW